MRICNFASLEDKFNFGRYHGLSLADVLDINSSYLSWCVKHCTGMIFQLTDTAVEEIRAVYPKFIMDSLFEDKRIWNLYRDHNEELDNDYDADWDDSSDYEETRTYDRYGESWAQDVEGYSDDDIDTIFDGNPSAFWNID